MIEKVKEKVKEAKEKRLEDLARKVNSGSAGDRTWWSLIGDIYTQRENNMDAPLLINGVLNSNPRDKAEALNDYFSNISTLEGEDHQPPEPLGPNIP